MQNWQRIALFIAAVCALLFIEYRFYFAAKFSELSNLKADMTSLDSEISLIKPKEIYNFDLPSSQKYIKAEIEKISNKLPYEDEIPELIHDFINSASNRLDINYEFIRPARPLADGKYMRLPIELGLSSDFSDMLRYLENIETMSTSIREDYFELNTEQTSLNINIKMNISSLLNAGASPDHKYSSLLTAPQAEPTKEAVKTIKKMRRALLLPHFRGIYKSTKTKAFIDDSILSVGDTIKGYLIEEISDNFVIVSKGYKRYTLKLGR